MPLLVAGSTTPSAGVLLAVVLLASPVAGQGREPGTAVTRPGGVDRPPSSLVRQGTPDSLRPPLSPGRAFLNSMLLPGLGQARLRRQIPGAIYVTLEAVSFAMLYKTSNELRIAKARSRNQSVNSYRVNPTTGAPVLDEDGGFVAADSVENDFGPELVNARRSQFEDWVTIVVFNHLFSGADAFVASLLWDVPARVGFRPAPFGLGVGINVVW